MSVAGIGISGSIFDLRPLYLYTNLEVKLVNHIEPIRYYSYPRTGTGLTLPHMAKVLMISITANQHQ